MDEFKNDTQLSKQLDQRYTLSSEKDLSWTRNFLKWSARTVSS